MVPFDGNILKMVIILNVDFLKKLEHEGTLASYLVNNKRQEIKGLWLE